MKQYITWKRFKVSENQYIHPTFGVENTISNIKFTEMEFNDGADIYIGYIEGEENDIKQVIDIFKIHDMVVITPAIALNCCVQWAGNYFELDEDGFTIIDNRPEDILE